MYPLLMYQKKEFETIHDPWSYVAAMTVRTVHRFPWKNTTTSTFYNSAIAIKSKNDSNADSLSGSCHLANKTDL